MRGTFSRKARKLRSIGTGGNGRDVLVHSAGRFEEDFKLCKYVTCTWLEPPGPLVNVVSLEKTFSSRTCPQNVQQLRRGQKEGAVVAYAPRIHSSAGWRCVSETVPGSSSSHHRLGLLNACRWQLRQRNSLRRSASWLISHLMRAGRT